MRPCLSSVVRLQASELKREDLRGFKWLVLRYAYYNLEAIQTSIRIAKQEGLCVSVDLASFEAYLLYLLELLEAGHIDLCFANEDEARELLRGELNANPEDALNFLGKHCKWAVVTLDPKGCIAKHGREVVRVPAIGKEVVTDATGADDLFASGFLYGLVKGLSQEDCCKVGSCSGGSIIRSLGGEVVPANEDEGTFSSRFYRIRPPSPLPSHAFISSFRISGSTIRQHVIGFGLQSKTRIVLT